MILYKLPLPFHLPAINGDFPVRSATWQVWIP